MDHHPLRIITKRATAQFLVLGLNKGLCRVPVHHVVVQLTMHKVKKRRGPKAKKLKLPKKKRYYRLKVPKPPRQNRVRFSFPRAVQPPKVPKMRKRKPRVRHRTAKTRYYEINRLTGAIPVDYVFGPLPLDTFRDWTVKPCNMSRVTGTLMNGVLRQCYFYGPDGPLFDVMLEDYPSQYTYFIDPAATRYVWEPFVNHLKVKKLATSNQADLLTAFAEFDDTVAMMNTKAIKSTSYGSVKWGWMPLVSDIMAANDAANNVKASLLSGNARSQNYNATHTISKSTGDIPVNGGIVFHKWEVKVKYTGTITYENNVLAFYDYMGFHPSPKIAWDLIPLSFAVDMILPIGDMLKALTPAKGWVKSANFTGWRVITATVTEKIKKPRSGYHSTIFDAERGSITYVTREYLSGVALEQKSFHKEIEAIKLPSWEQAFDLTYLANAFYDRGKKLLSPHVYRKRRR